MSQPRYPSLYQINTRVWLTELSRQLGRRATLNDIPDEALDRFAQQGFDWIWLLSVWQTGAAGQSISRGNAGWRHEFEQTLTDLTDEDIAGSGFAITNYRVHDALGGDDALSRVRQRMSQRGLKLMLDFVPNHMAPDHPWVSQHSDYFIGGTEADLANAPQNYFRVATNTGPRVFAHGRDPYFPGWPDTIQLNYGNPDLQEAMIQELSRIASQCDGVRCDMAMLILPDIFRRTWNIAAQPFWPTAIAHVRATHPGFTFMAEVYWDLEWELQQQGFHYCYDKRLYDRLREGHVQPIRQHLQAGLDFQDGLARFLENHDEPRAAATFDSAKHRAAAVITFLSPGLRFFHQGQFEGRIRRISPHLVRAPAEVVDNSLADFYERLLSVLRRPVLRNGAWQQLECFSAWAGNWTHECFLAFGWQSETEPPILVAVNFSEHPSQCRIRFPFFAEQATTLQLHDLISSANYDGQSNQLASDGLYVDLPAWGIHVLEIRIQPTENANH